MGSQQLTVQLPAGTKCTGPSGGTGCIVSFTTAGGFGNCVAVQQKAAASTNNNAGTAAAAGGAAAAGAAAGSKAASSTTTGNANGQKKGHKHHHHKAQQQARDVDVRAVVSVHSYLLPFRWTDGCIGYACCSFLSRVGRVYVRS